MENAAALSNRTRVLVLCALMLAAFAVFNAIFWPLHTAQLRRAPENFHAYARTLSEGGDRTAAIVVLQQGIDRFRPPLAAPYADLQSWLIAVGQPEGAIRQEPARQLYTAFDPGVADRTAALKAAAAAALQLRPVNALPKSMERPTALLAVSVATLAGLTREGFGLSYAEQLGLLQATGGALRGDGFIGETGVRSPVNILVQSGGGEGLYRQAHIVVEGRDLGRPRRGFHVVLIESDTGRIVGSSIFDVWSGLEEAERMTRYLEDTVAGTIGAFAVYDDASVNLTPALAAALVSFGCEPDAYVQRTPVLFGQQFSFAALGVKGAARGTALQAWSPYRYRRPNDPQVYFGHPVTCGVLLDGEAST